MDSDDDIFIIYTRTEAYLKKLEEQKRNLQQQRQQLLHKLLVTQPPYGYTKDDWKRIAGIHHVDSKCLFTTATRFSFKEAKEIIEEIELLSYIDAFEETRDFFYASAKDIMLQYRQLIENPIHTDFMNTKRADANREANKIKNSLIELVIQLFGDEASTYLINRSSIKGLMDEVKKNDTSHCEEVYENDGQEEDWNCMVYNDLHRINFNQKYKYDKRQHFRDTINQYQGLQQKNIPQKVIDDVVKMIRNHGLFDASKEDPAEQYAKVTKDHIRMFLEESGHPKSYEDLHLIYNRVTTKPCPNIQKYEAALYEDFDQLVEAFLSLPNMDRKNFLNTHYTLNQLLRRRGVIVPENDLRPLKTPARLRAHDDIYQACCLKLGWNFKPLS